MNKIEELEKQLDAEKKKLKSDFIKECEASTGLKVGDEIELIRTEWDNHDNCHYIWTKSKITDFEKRSVLGVNTSLWGCSFINVSEVKLFDENDYTLRHSIWERELDIDDEFQLLVDKPKSTKGKIYTVSRVIKIKGGNIEYGYFNDYGKMASLYEGEFHVTTES